MNTYTLNDAGEPVLVPTNEAWTVDLRRRVGDENITINGESVRVSTIFLVLDHNWGGGPPVLWETMVFGGTLNDEQERCGGNRADAEAMHKRMIERVKATGIA